MTATKSTISVVNNSHALDNGFYIFQQTPPGARNTFSSNIFEQFHKAPVPDLKDGRLNWNIDYATNLSPTDGKLPRQPGPDILTIDTEAYKLLIDTELGKP
ncbi:hypothetical protein [Undibacterium sp. TC9W]|uniref:hypothetical protein n=1 Tax=Undibacterium sp. TC9W TaxID=3413053 RepID=UPI003BEF725C